MASNANNCSSSADRVFGPIVPPGCRGGFDFTLLFEQSLLNLVPAVLFLLALLLRSVYLTRASVKTFGHLRRYVKLGATLVLIGVQTALLVCYAQDERTSTMVSVPAAALSLAVSLQLLFLSWLEDARSVRPSTAITLCLLATVFCDLPQARTLWLLGAGHGLAALFSASLGVKLCLLVLEARSKRAWLAAGYRHLPPESTSGVINRSFLWWINALFVRGFRKVIGAEELFPLDQELASLRLKTRLQQAWDTRQQPERRLELVWAVCRALWRPMLVAVPPRLCLIVLTFSQPFLISSILTLTAAQEDELSTNKGYGLVAATALLYTGLSIMNLHYSQTIHRCVTMSRGALVGLIYDRALLIPDGLYDEAKAVTLMSSDTDLLAESIISIHDCWAYAVQVAIGLYLLARQLGWICIMPLALVTVASYFTSLIARNIGGQQKLWIDAVQKRVAVTSSVLVEMRSVKMMGLSKLMADTIQALRLQETDRMAGYRWSIVWKNVVSNAASLLGPALTLAIYAIQSITQGDGSSFDTTKAFTSLAIVHLLVDPFALLVQSVPMTAASIGSFDRVQQFLVAPTRKDERMAVASSESGVRCSSAAIEVEHLDLRPVPGADVVLRGTNFNIPQASLTMVVGPVASGKTTLLKAILGEGLYDAGTIRVADKRIAYCGQKVWLPNSTIRKAICGHLRNEEIDEAWYQSCLRACALDHDLALFPKGDQTMVGSGSTSLSGGQKHRVALARALYTRSKIMLFDNVLSALDNNTAKIVVESCFGRRGLLKEIGSTALLVTHSREYFSSADNILIVSDGKVQFFDAPQGSTRTEALGEILTKISLPSREFLQDTDKSIENILVTSEDTERDDLTRRLGDAGLYGYLFRTVGWPKFLLFLFFVCLDVFGDAFTQIWLERWTEAGNKHWVLYASVYLGLPIVALIGIAGFAWSMVILITVSTSNKLHLVLLNTIMRAPQSFFSTTDTGAILNRFSQDMTLIEGGLVLGAGTFANNGIRLIAAVGLIALGSVYMTITLPIVFITLYFLQHVYLRTSRQLRLLDLESKNPLYSNFLETVSGLSTIRALDWQQDCENENIKLLDRSQQPSYLLSCCQRWLTLVLGLIVAGEAVLTVGLAVGLRYYTSAGFLGVSLNCIIFFENTLSSVVSNWTQLEGSLGALMRTKDLERDVQPEDRPGESQEPPLTWPKRGEIQLHDVTASHSSNAVGVRHISVNIGAGQKVGICGRTGSGKSSLVATLLRLLEINHGSITIDGVDLATVPRDIIRSRLVALPQDPLVFIGTIRFNLSPHGTAADEDMIQALADVGLWDVLRERGGLDAETTPSTLSKGQEQLLALARALLKKGRIFLLDEPTSSIDSETDKTVQRILREKCAGCTVLTVAHRMQTILDSDVVIVMEEGMVVEFGDPDELLQQGGAFSRLVNG